MIKRSLGSIGEGINFTLTEENYYGHTLHNINIIAHNRFLDKSGADSILDFFDSNGLKPLWGLIFLSAGYPELKKADTFRVSLESAMPVTSLKTELMDHASIQVICVSGTKVYDIGLNKPESGNFFRADGTSYYYLNNIQEIIGSENWPDQAYNSLKRLKSILAGNKLTFSNIVRTWLYLDNILDWYGDLNSARSKFFLEEGVFNNFIPASTGIGSGNFEDKALTLSSFGISGERDSVSIKMVPSPMQCPALNYKSSFSRAVIIKTKEYKKLIISGTASIDQNGETIFHNCTEKQIEKTLDIVNAILKANGMSFSDTVRAIAYFPNIEFIEHFVRICKKYNLDSNYILKVSGIVCRDDLLFELELDAVVWHS